MAGDVNAWWTSIDQLPQLIERLRRVQLLHQPAIEAIRRFDRPDALIYCDPPYLHDTRAPNSIDVYGIEMTTKEHSELGQTLSKCQSKIVISGYPSKLYEDMFCSWRRIEFDIANHSAGGREKSRKRETVWLNW